MADGQQSQVNKFSLGNAPRGLSSLGSGVKFPSAAHATRLQEVIEQINDLKKLTATVNELETKLLNLAAKQTPNLTEREATVWQTATQKIGDYLRQPIQVSSDKKPIPLESTLELLTSWVNAFEQNLAVDGVGLQEDEERLANFQIKISQAAVSAPELIKAGQKLLTDRQLDQKTIEENFSLEKEAEAKDQNRLSAIDKVLNNFYAQWEEQVANLEESLAKLKNELNNLENEDAEVKKEAKVGLAKINGLETDQLVRVRTQLGQWVDKYRDDKTFTADQLNEQIKAELLPLMRNYQQAAQQIEADYSLENLRTKTEELKNKLRNRLNNELKELTETREILVNTRKQKLSLQPDERYFGQVAKLVNDEIASLNKLLEQGTKLNTETSLGPDFETNLKKFEQAAQNQLKEGQNLVNKEQLEKLLEQSWQRASIAELSEIVAQAKKDLVQIKNKLDQLALAQDGLEKIEELEGKLNQAIDQAEDLIEVPTSQEEFLTIGEEIEEDAAELRAELNKLSQPHNSEASSQAIPVKTESKQDVKEKAQKLVVKDQSVAIAKASQPKQELMVKKEDVANQEETTETTNNDEDFNEQIKPVEVEKENDPQLKTDIELGIKHFKVRLKKSLEYFKDLESYNKEWPKEWYQRINEAVAQPIIPGERISLNQLLTQSPDLSPVQQQYAQLAISNQGQLALLLKEIESFVENHSLETYKERQQNLYSLFGKVGQKDRLTKSRQSQLNSLKQKEVTGKPAQLAAYSQQIEKLEDDLNKVSAKILELKQEVSELRDYQLTNPRFEVMFANLSNRLDEVKVPELELPTIRQEASSIKSDRSKTDLSSERSAVEKLVE